MAIRGLEPGAEYRLILFAARSGTDGGIGRLTRYTIGEDWLDLEVGDNLARTAVFDAIEATSLGEITLDVRVSPAGAGRFGYLGAMVMERLP